MAVEGGLADYLPVRARIDGAVLVAVDVAAQHIGHAVRVHAPQVGQHQHIGPQLGVAFRHSQPLEYVGYGGLQGLSLHKLGFVVVYLELLQHG